MFNKRFIGFFIFFGLQLIIDNVGYSQAKKTQGPNVVFILADDLGYGDLSCYGQKKFKTPNIDKLAASGMLFTQHYAGSTVCSPSRSALLTGLHTGHTPVRGNKTFNQFQDIQGQFPLPAQTVTLPKILQQEGYKTGAFGKWGLGYPGSEGDPTRQGFDSFYGFKCQGIAHSYYPDFLWDNNTKVELPGNAGTQRLDYAPDVIHAKTLDFIEKNKSNAFFLFISSTIPHAELSVPEQDLQLFLKADSNQQKNSIFSPEEPYTGVDDPADQKFRKGGYGSQRYPRATFAAMVTALDKQVGEVMRKLEELGLVENTIIIFSSDNGPHLEGGADPEFFDSNGLLKGFKRDLYEGGIRVPLLVSWKGKIKAGSISDHISACWDFLPTLSELTEAKLQHQTDGLSMVNTLLQKGKQANHSYLYWEFHERGKKQAVRKGNWKGVRLNIEQSPEGPIELYNLKADISEQQNVALQYPAIVKQIELIMKQAHTPDSNWPFFNTEK